MIFVATGELETEELSDEQLIAVTETTVAVHEPQLGWLVMALRDRRSEEVRELRSQNAGKIDAATAARAHSRRFAVVDLDPRRLRRRQCRDRGGRFVDRQQ